MQTLLKAQAYQNLHPHKGMAGAPGLERVP